MVRQVANRRYVVKASKIEAEYDPGPERRFPCQDCTYFIQPGRCTEVAGEISPTGTCKWFNQAPGRDRNTIGIP